METICTHTHTHHNAELPGDKIQGISFKMELWLQPGELVYWTLTPKNRGGDKSPSAGGRWREEEGWRISELPGVGALLDLDNCLQRSLDTSRQMPLPIKHSVARSFTP